MSNETYCLGFEGLHYYINLIMLIISLNLHKLSAHQMIKIRFSGKTT